MSATTTHNSAAVDLVAAQAYFDMLGGAHYVQVFADAPGADVKPWHAPITDASDPRLIEANEAGGGIFVVVNQTDGKGRKAENIVRVRAIFVDLDGASLDVLKRFGLKPHIIIKSSAGRFHCYWLVGEGFPLDQFRPIQKQLAALLGGDPSVSDPSRVMRVPGFFHRKGEPFLVEIIRQHAGARYTFDDIVSALPQPEPEPEPKPRASVTPPPTLSRAKIIDRARRYVEKMDPAVSGEKGHNKTYSAAMRLANGFGLTIDEARPILTEHSRRCDPPWSEREIEHKLKDADANKDKCDNPIGYLLADDRRDEGQRPLPPGPDRGRVEVTVRTGYEMEVNNEAIGALARNDDNLFQRGGALVTIARETRPDNIERPDGAATIRTVGNAQLRERLAAAIQFMTLHKPAAEPQGELITLDDGTILEKRPASPPRWCVEAINARGTWPGIKPLEGLIDAPTLRPDGTLLDTPGYDRRTGLYLVDHNLKLDVPSHPTEEAVRQAVAALLEVFVDFPFATEAHRAAALAGLLTMVGRYAFDGCAPLFLIDANTRGSGKGLLTDAIALIGRGASLARMTGTTDDDEMRKRITATALAGDTAVLLDNLGPRGLGCSALDAALTSETWRDRILGRSENTAELPLRIVWFATGNNVMLRADTARRVLHVRLESPMERPEEREDFRHANLRAWIRAERPRLLSAALTILRGFFAAGRPEQGVKAWGSFEGWNALIPPALVWAGLPDPCAAREELMESADREAATLRALLAGLREIDPRGRGMMAKDIIEAASREDAPDGLAEVVAELAEGRAGKPNATTLGRRLNRMRGRVCGGLALQKMPERSSGGNLWGAIRVDSAVSAVSAVVSPSLAREVSEQNTNVLWGPATALSASTALSTDPDDGWRDIDDAADA